MFHPIPTIGNDKTITAVSGWVKAMSILAIGCLCISSATAKPGNGTGTGTAKPPAIPTLAAPIQIAQGSTNVIFNVDGENYGNRQYLETITEVTGTISASFSGTGVTVNSITVNSGISLTLDVSLDADATIGNQTLTVTNPDGQSSTGTDPIIYVIDLPVINAATISPSPNVNTTESVSVAVTDVTNFEGSAVTYTYQWLENGIVTGITTNTLPASATTAGATYTCAITPSKGSIQGPTFSTNTITCVVDGDNDNLNDEWEVEYFNSIAVNPNDDADGDGLSNQAEFIFGLNPTDSKSCSAIKQALNPTTGEFSYSRPANDLPDVTYTVYTSTDLVNWTEQTLVTETPTNNNGKSKIIIAGIGTEQTANNKQLFVRVGATY